MEEKYKKQSKNKETPSIWGEMYYRDDGRHACEHAVLDRVRGERIDDLVHAVVRGVVGYSGEAEAGVMLTFRTQSVRDGCSSTMLRRR